MNKTIVLKLFTAFLVISIISTPAFAEVTKPTGLLILSPIKIWDALLDLQAQIHKILNQIANIQLIPGPAGPKGNTGPAGTCSCDITKADYDALLARVAALENAQECISGQTRPCGSNVGVCKQGTQTCVNFHWDTNCVGEIKPSTETCNGLDDDCDGQVDEGGVCQTSCTADNQCQSGYYCLVNTCVAKQPNGNPCTAGNSCISGFCADDYCCNSACSGACDSCGIGGLQGTCTLLTVGSSGLPSCTPYFCDGVSANCPATCATNSQCQLGYYCSGGMCVAKQSNGGACTSSDSCLSGWCVGSHCCGAGLNYCNGACMDTSSNPTECAVLGATCMDCTASGKTCQNGVCV